MSSNNTCATCRWWNREEIPNYDDPKRIGECRRYPPNQTGLWPPLAAADWCGEWREKADG